MTWDNIQMQPIPRHIPSHYVLHQWATANVRVWEDEALRGFSLTSQDGGMLNFSGRRGTQIFDLSTSLHLTIFDMMQLLAHEMSAHLYREGPDLILLSSEKVVLGRWIDKEMKLIGRAEGQDIPSTLRGALSSLQGLGYDADSRALPETPPGVEVVEVDDTRCPPMPPVRKKRRPTPRLPQGVTIVQDGGGQFHFDYSQFEADFLAKFIG